MLIPDSFNFVQSYVNTLDLTLGQVNPSYSLSKAQKAWISFCVMGILMTNTVCWAKFSRQSMGRYSVPGLSWMFRRGKIMWDLLLFASVKQVLINYGIEEGVLVIDDSDKKRSKSTKRISYVHKIKDKASGGYFMGQSLVFMVLVTSKITIPVGFRFYQPDPLLSAWNKQEKNDKQKSIPKSERLPKPPKNPQFPTKQELALRLLEEFEEAHPSLKIKAVLADALYGNQEFVEKASCLFQGVQVITQMRCNQKIHYHNREWSVDDFFSSHPGVSQTLSIRGGQEVRCTIGSARLYVKAHQKKLFVIALKYEDEENYRFLIASDLSWRTQDIVETYTFRWLVEVFFQDWKGHEGWGQLTKQLDEEGSSRSLILSLLLDHCLLLHPEQLTRLENNLPACTVGSLQEKTKIEGIFSFIRQILKTGDPQEKLQQLSDSIEKIFELRASGKHMATRDMGRMEPTASLKYK